MAACRAGWMYSIYSLVLHAAPTEKKGCDDNTWETEGSVPHVVPAVQAVSRSSGTLLAHPPLS